MRLKNRVLSTTLTKKGSALMDHDHYPSGSIQCEPDSEGVINLSQSLSCNLSYHSQGLFNCSETCKSEDIEDWGVSGIEYYLSYLSQPHLHAVHPTD